MSGQRKEKPASVPPDEGSVQEADSSSSGHQSSAARPTTDEPERHQASSSSSSSSSRAAAARPSWRQRREKSFSELKGERDERVLSSPPPCAPPQSATAELPHRQGATSQQAREKPKTTFDAGYLRMRDLEEESAHMPLRERKEYVAGHLLQFANGHVFHPLAPYDTAKFSRKKGMRLDKVALEAINRDESNSTYLMPNSVPVCALGNGSCFYNSMSLGLYGHEGYAEAIQFRTAVALLKRNPRYKHHPRNHMIELVSGQDDDEIFLEACRENEPSSPRHIQACSDTMRCRIILQTPRIGSRMSEEEHDGWNYVFTPLSAKTEQQRESLPTVQIIFHYSAGVCEDWRPNHFVPVLPYEIEEKKSKATSRAESESRQTSSDTGTYSTSRQGSDVTTSSESPPEIVVAKGKIGPKKGVISMAEIFRKLREEDVDGEEIPNGLKKRVYFIVQTIPGREEDALVDDVGRYKPKSSYHDYDYLREGEKLKVMEENKGEWFYGVQSSRSKNERKKVDPPPGEQNSIQFRRQYKYGPGDAFKRTVTWITKIRPEEQYLKRLRFVQYSGEECGGGKNKRPHGNAIKVGDFHIADRFENNLNVQYIPATWSSDITSNRVYDQF